MEEMTPINIRQMIKHGFKFNTIEHNNKFTELRWYSNKFGERGYEYWFEIVLGKFRKWERTDEEQIGGIEFCWLHWDMGGGIHFVHIPNLSKVQTMEGLLKMMYGLGYPEITTREDADVEERYEKHKELYEKHDN